MKNYQDRWTRFHDRPTDGSRPSSNNGWIYSAYARHVAPEMLQYVLLENCLNYCTVDSEEFKINRSPKQVTPPFSRDEVMGIMSLFRKHPYSKALIHRLEKNHWNFCNFESYKKEPLTINRIITAADILIDIQDKHRNHVWENNLEEAYCLAFRLPPSDIYYIKKLYGKKPNLLETAHFYAETLQTIYKGDRSGNMITWLKIKDLGLEDTFLGKKVIAKEKEYFVNYFGKGHILYQKLVDNS